MDSDSSQMAVNFFLSTQNKKLSTIFGGLRGLNDKLLSFFKATF